MLDKIGSREKIGEHFSRQARGGALEKLNNAVLDLFLERVDAEINVLAPLPVRW